MKKRWFTIGVVAAGLLLVPLITPFFAPWSGINCRHQDINIKTGQARYSRMLWFVKVSERIEETPLSLALEGRSVDVADINPWHRVNTFSPGARHSPHYIFHSALYQARQLEMLDSMVELTPDRKQEIVTAILTAWQQSGSDSGADEMISQLMDEVISR